MDKITCREVFLSGRVIFEPELGGDWEKWRETNWDLLKEKESAPEKAGREDLIELRGATALEEKSADRERERGCNVEKAMLCD